MLANPEQDSLKLRTPEAVHMLTSIMVLHPALGAVRLVDGDTTVLFEFYLRKRLTTPQLREFSKDLRASYHVFTQFSKLPLRQLKIYRADKGRPSAGSRAVSKSMESDSGEGLSAVEAEPMAQEAEQPIDISIDVDKEVLERLQPLTFADFWEGLTQAVECLVVERDLATLTREEIDMLVAIMSDEFGDRLVMGPNSFVDDERVLMESEAFNAALDTLKSQLELNCQEIVPVSHSSEVIAYRDDLRVIVFVSNGDKASG